MHPPFYRWSFTEYLSHLLFSHMKHSLGVVIEWSSYTFISMLASNHTNDLINSVTGTCHSTLNMWTLGNKCWGLNRCQTCLNARSTYVSCVPHIECALLEHVCSLIVLICELHTFCHHTVIHTHLYYQILAYADRQACTKLTIWAQKLTDFCQWSFVLR